jgi:hypothetical protein
MSCDESHVSIAVVNGSRKSGDVPSQLAQRAWTSWLLIVPIARLVALGYSLMQYFVTLCGSTFPDGAMTSRAGRREERLNLNASRN